MSLLCMAPLVSEYRGELFIIEDLQGARADDNPGPKARNVIGSCSCVLQSHRPVSASRVNGDEIEKLAVSCARSNDADHRDAHDGSQNDRRVNRQGEPDRFWNSQAGQYPTLQNVVSKLGHTGEEAGVVAGNADSQPGADRAEGSGNAERLPQQHPGLGYALYPFEMVQYCARGSQQGGG